MPTDNPLVQQATARSAQQDQQDESAAYMASMYGGRGAYGGPMGGGEAYGGGYDPLSAPQYGGVMPNRDFGYERFVSHNLGSTRFDSDNPNIGKAMSGPYQGQTRGQMYESLHGDYAKMSPEQRQPWEARRFNQDVRSGPERQDQGFQFSDQTDRWGNKGSSWTDVRGAGGGQPGGATMPAPSYANGVGPAAPMARGVGASMSTVTPMPNAVTAPASPRFAQSMAGQPQAPMYSNQPQAQPSNDFNPGSMNMGSPTRGPQYSISQAGGTDLSNINNGGTHQADAQAPGWRQNGTGRLADAVTPTDPFAVRSSAMVAQNGNPNDTDKFGPKLSGGGALPVASWSQPKAPQYLADGTLQSPGDKPGSTPWTARTGASSMNATAPSYLADGTLRSPGDSATATPFRSMTGRNMPGGNPPTASRMVTTPIPAPAGASLSVR